ncbi:antibiotic biosynthesis monooxygenase [uncultured Roseibium sp.]|uniref:antibiotic biosynthesis monooxygenase n=1 Tax=uncultured Roseibium sp. TaxID=1936171 RepID=UPI0026344A4F|nr:antibiotic biosynthesis monooxygenase [uncultured Roseibium sp.]
MIKRIWRGWTTRENADRYFQILTGSVIPGIEAMKVPGYLGIEVLRRPHADGVEFMTIMRFRAIEDIIAFQGPDYERSHVPEAARQVLSCWDQSAWHYEHLTNREAAEAN